MEDVGSLLDATYLKTAEQAGLSKEANRQVVASFVQEAIDFSFKLVMIRPDFVDLARQMIDDQGSTLLVGTVIDFPGGASVVGEKLQEAEALIESGADELDFVLNYEAFKRGELSKVKDEIEQCTALCLSKARVVKWIIETAALSDEQIASVSSLIKEVVLTNFGTEQMPSVFVKTSTGFYQTLDGSPSGATLEAVRIIKANASPLPIKAAGGVRNLVDVEQMVKEGVRRIGTSSAKEIVLGKKTNKEY
jgi:deoxyribose-phosphate aldolase